MGHVELATPVTHIWYFKGTPSRMGQLLDISPRNLEKIIYFASFIITDLHEEKLDEALDAIDRDFEARIQEVRFEVEDTIASMEEDLDNQRQALESQVKQDVDRLRTKSDKDVRAIKEEAEMVLKVLTDAKGEFASDDVKLSWLEDPTVMKGAKITPKYLRAIEPAADEAIAAVQEKLEQSAQDASERRAAQLEIEQDRVVEARANQDRAIEERAAPTRIEPSRSARLRPGSSSNAARATWERSPSTSCSRSFDIKSLWKRAETYSKRPVAGMLS
jgi:DNA-directed RNA polymerase subunit beta'